MPIDSIPSVLPIEIPLEKPKSYHIRETVPQGCANRPANGTNDGNIHTITWPAVQELKSTLATQSMRFSKIEWRVPSNNFYNIKFTNKKGEVSPRIGYSDNFNQSITLRDVQIAKITTYTDDDYFKGLKIDYRDGISQTVESTSLGTANETVL